VTWHQAVERAVVFMRERMANPLRLDELAHAALLSPYHFNRVFRLVTGIPPGQFLTALRMAEAKRLLLTTSQRVTDVCFAVGFESLGTFTTRFGQLVGVAPQELRRLAERHGRRLVTYLAAADADEHPSVHCVRGWLEPPPGESCVTLVGVFDRAVPQGMPSACDVVARTPGSFCVPGVAPGRHHVLAVGFPLAQTLLDATLLEPHRLVVGALSEPVSVEPGGEVWVHLLMDRPGAIGPPIVLAAPLLAAEAKAHAWSSVQPDSMARTA
jgi:AraC-like DNA-binding protein